MITYSLQCKVSSIWRRPAVRWYTCECIVLQTLAWTVEGAKCGQPVPLLYDLEDFANSHRYSWMVRWSRAHCKITTFGRMSLQTIGISMMQWITHQCSVTNLHLVRWTLPIEESPWTTPYKSLLLLPTGLWHLGLASQTCMQQKHQRLFDRQMSLWMQLKHHLL